MKIRRIFMIALRKMMKMMIIIIITGEGFRKVK